MRREQQEQKELLSLQTNSNNANTHMNGHTTTESIVPSTQYTMSGMPSVITM